MLFDEAAAKKARGVIDGADAAKIVEEWKWVKRTEGVIDISEHDKNNDVALKNIIREAVAASVKSK